MIKRDYSRIHLHIHDTNQALRSNMRHAMNDYGFGVITESKRFGDFQHVVASNTPDVVLCDVDEDFNSIINLVTGTRKGKYGNNPFVPIISYSWAPSREKIKKILQSGFDDILARPCAPADIIVRIGMMSGVRRSYVATSGYLGPDRRTMEEGRGAGKLFYAPNTLGARIKGATKDEVARMATSGWQDAKEMRAQNCSFELAAHISLLTPSVAAGENLDIRELNRLQALASVSWEGLPEEKQRRGKELFTHLYEVIEEMKEKGGSQKFARAMDEISLAMALLTGAGEDETAIRKRIKHQVDMIIRYNNSIPTG